MTTCDGAVICGSEQQGQTKAYEVEPIYEASIIYYILMMMRITNQSFADDRVLHPAGDIELDHGGPR